MQYEFEVLAFNQHMITPSYKGYSGPSNVVIGTPSSRPPTPTTASIIAHNGFALQQCTVSQPCIITSANGSRVVLDPRASSSSQVYTGCTLQILTGPGKDELRQIISYDGGSRTATVREAFSAAGGMPSNQSTYRIVRYAVSLDRATVTWARVQGAQRYRVSYRPADALEVYNTSLPVLGADGQQDGACLRVSPEGTRNPALLSHDTLCVELTGLSTSQRYQVTISAGNDHLSWGFPSPPVFPVPMTQPTETPSHGAVVRQDALSVTLTWSAPTTLSPPTHFYRVRFASFNVNVDDVDALSESAWTDTPLLPVYTDQEEGYFISGLPRAMGYIFKVYAGNVAGFSYPPMLMILPQQVQQLSVVSVRSTGTSTGQVSLTWQAPPMAVYFQVLVQATAALGAGPLTPFAPIAGGGIINGTSIVRRSAPGQNDLRTAGDGRG